MTAREAHVTWKGGLAKGTGTASAGSSGLFNDLPVSWPSRIQDAKTETSPEELIAAAHASCFAMQLSGELEREGQRPEELRVHATVRFENTGNQWAITGVELDVEGQVPGMNAETFHNACERAKEACPVSRALKGNVQLSVTSTLHGASPV